LKNLKRPGKKAQVSFNDPDVVIIVETIANRAAVALITREMKEKYPLIKVSDRKA